MRALQAKWNNLKTKKTQKKDAADAKPAGISQEIKKKAGTLISSTISPGANTGQPPVGPPVVDELLIQQVHASDDFIDKSHDSKGKGEVVEAESDSDVVVVGKDLDLGGTKINRAEISTRFVEDGTIIEWGDKSFTVIGDEPLGTGQFGAVYLVKDKATGDQFAMKILDKSNDDCKKENVLREFVIQKQLHHPNALEVYDIAETGDYFILQLELVEGATDLYYLAIEAH